MDFKILRSAKISVKLTAAYALFFSLALLVLNASILYGIKYYLYNQSRRQVEDVKTIILNKISGKSNNENLSNDEFLKDIPSRENVSVKILRKDGTILNSSPDFNYQIDLGEPLNKIKYRESDDERLFFEVVGIGNARGGIIYLQIVKNLQNEHEFLQILFVIMAIADLLGIISSIILGYLVSKRLLRPIDNIAKTAERISFNNLKERIEVIGPDDELNRLGTIFNSMIDGLQEAFNRQNQFVSDASHELKTPIAVIQGYANLLDRWGKDDSEALEKSIYGIKLEAENMANLIENLLILAKGDSGNLAIDKKTIWLNEIINEVVAESRLIADNRIITSNRNEKVKVIGDSKMLKQLLRIFIDNSIKFSSEASHIDLSTFVEKNNVKITIFDNGIGIPKDEMEKVFDRFYTVDKSRSKEKGGTGLGLSIAKRIVDIHKGSIELDSKDGQYTKITVTLNTW